MKLTINLYHVNCLAEHNENVYPIFVPDEEGNLKCSKCADLIRINVSTPEC